MSTRLNGFSALISITGRWLNFTMLNLPGPVATARRMSSARKSTNRAHISTSMIERQNLTMRMSMRRFTRLTNAFSKKLENLQAAVGLHFAHYNFVRLHSSLRTTPAMAAGIDARLWSLEELVDRTSN